MKNISNPLLLPRLLYLAYSIFLVLSLDGCSSANRSRLFDNRPREMGLIIVEPFKVYADALTELPQAKADIAQNLTEAVRRALMIENRLQLKTQAHSLRMIAMVLAYQNGFLDVQAELYNDEDLVSYIHIKRPIKPEADWKEAADLIAAQLLDQLMARLCSERGSEYPELCTVMAEPVVVDPCAYAADCIPPAPIYLDFSASWNVWRKHREHDEHGKPSPPRWMSGAIIDSLPRSTRVERAFTQQRPKSSSGNGESSSSVWSSPSSTSSSDDTGSSSHSDYGRSNHQYTPPASHHESHSQTYSSHAEHSSPAVSAPRPHHESTDSSSSGSGGSSSGSDSHHSHSSHSAPGSHKGKHE